MKKMSFVIPCYRSQNTIASVVDEVRETADKLQIKDYEIILVNDWSPDGVWSEIKRLSLDDKHVKGICLARNFGQHAALMAGYAAATGEFIVSLDDDGQTPIDELPKLLDKFDEGFDVVYAYYEDIQQKFYRKLGTKIADKMTEVLIGMPKGNRGSSFYVMKSFVKDEILRYSNAYPYLAGLVYRTTKNVACVQAKHRSRMEGESGYSLSALIHLWFNGFSAFSSKPLEISAYLGGFISGAGFIYAIVIIIKRLFGASSVAGWSTLACLILIIGGMILLTLGLIGEYVGRIYISINSAPQYVIRETTEEIEE